MILSMPCAEASIVVTATGTPSRDTRTAACPFVSTQASFTPFQKCEAVAMNFATRSRPETGTRAARTIPPPSEEEITSCSEEAFQSGHVSLLRGGDKGLQKAPLLARTDGVHAAICDVFTGAGDELADVCFLHLQYVRDLVVGIIECFAQNICGTFCGREFLEEQQDRKLQCFTALRTYSGIAAGVHWFGKPGPDVGFAARVSGLG